MVRLTSTSLPLLDLQAQHASIHDELQAAMAKVVAHGRLVNGPEVGEFEEAFARYSGARHCVGVASGTSAIELVLRAAGIGAGDEVITTPMTFIATVEPLLLVGARPVLVDVDPETALLRCDAVEAAVTARTAAIMPVHLYGQTVDLDAFRSLADRCRVLLIEDAAQAHGASWRGRRAGSVGDAATFSFFPAKNLGALGDAGAVTTNDGALADRIRKLRDHGRRDKYVHDIVGTNARLDTLQAAVLAAKLPHLEQWNAARRRHAAAYDRAFSGLEGVTPVRVVSDAVSVRHQYVVKVGDRDSAQALLAEEGIETGIHYPVPLHRQPALADVVRSDFPAADALARTVLSLPIFPELTDAQRSRIADVLASSVGAGPGVDRATAA